MKPAQQWFKAQGWQPFPFQKEVWQAVAEGLSGLLHATTGSGKTYAVWLAALNRFASAAKPAAATARQRKPVAPPLTVLWITPMRALASDTLRALREPLAALAPHWRSGLRSGDTPSTERGARRFIASPNNTSPWPESPTNTNPYSGKSASYCMKFSSFFAAMSSLPAPGHS